MDSVLVKAAPVDAHYDPGIREQDLVSFEGSDIFIPTRVRKEIRFQNPRCLLGIRHGNISF